MRIAGGVICVTCGQVVPTQYDASDRFCLGGQRLVGIAGTYGAGDSRIERVGASDIPFWYIAWYEEKFGNRIEYSYSENGATGEVVPTGVQWTAMDVRPTLSLRYSVTITYETRPSTDQRTGVDQDGAVWATTKRLASIAVEYNGSEIATYDLSYSTGTTGRRQLDDVTLSRGTDTLPETVRLRTQRGCEHAQLGRLKQNTRGITVALRSRVKIT